MPLKRLAPYREEIGKQNKFLKEKVRRLSERIR